MVKAIASAVIGTTVGAILGFEIAAGIMVIMLASDEQEGVELVHKWAEALYPNEE